MNEICQKCKKIIKKGDTVVVSVKNCKKGFYHARCFGAGYLKKEVLVKLKNNMPLPSSPT